MKTSPADPWVGRQLDRCKLERLLGQGGMGSVYRAYHTGLDIPVAVKILAPAYTAQAEWRERFLREARAAAKLDHAGVVRVLDVVASEDLCYLVMEFVDGTSLRGLVQERGPLPWTEVALAGRQAAAALAAAHALGLVHRDIKPDNLMIEPAGAVKIADFGLARREGKSELTTTGTISGTPAFMPPEQIDGGHIDGKADVYSLGVTLYALLAGDSPFVRESLFATIAATLEEPLPALPLGIAPRPLGGLLGRMCAKKPGARPSMREVEHELEAMPKQVASSGRRGAARPVSASAPTLIARRDSGAQAARAKAPQRKSSRIEGVPDSAARPSGARAAIPAGGRPPVALALGACVLVLLAVIAGLVARGSAPAVFPVAHGSGRGPGSVSAPPDVPGSGVDVDPLEPWRARHAALDPAEQLEALDELLATGDAQVRPAALAYQSVLRSRALEDARRVIDLLCAQGEFGPALLRLAQARGAWTADGTRALVTRVDEALLARLEASEVAFTSALADGRIDLARGVLPTLDEAAWDQLERARARRDEWLARLAAAAPPPDPTQPDPTPTQPDPTPPRPTPLDPEVADTPTTRWEQALADAPIDPPAFSLARTYHAKLAADPRFAACRDRAPPDPRWTELVCAAELAAAVETALAARVGTTVELHRVSGPAVRGVLRKLEDSKLTVEVAQRVGGSVATSITLVALEDVAWADRAALAARQLGGRGALVVGVALRVAGELDLAHRSLAQVKDASASEYARDRGIDLSASLETAGLHCDERLADEHATQAKRGRLVADGWLVTPAQFAAGLRRERVVVGMEPLHAIALAGGGVQALVGGASGAVHQVELAGNGGVRPVTAAAGGGVRSLVSDGRAVAYAATGVDGRSLVALAYGRARATRQHTAPIHQLALSPDEAWLAVASDAPALLDARSAALAPRGAFPDAAIGLTSTGWDPRGGTLYAAGADGSVARWRLEASGKLAQGWQGRAKGPLAAVVADGSGDGVLGVGGGELARWLTKARAPASGEVLASAGPGTAVAMHPSGLLAAVLSADGALSIFSTRPWALLARHQAHRAGPASPQALVFAWQGLVTVGLDGTLVVWRCRPMAADGEPATPVGAQRLRPAVYASGLRQRWALPLGTTILKLDGPRSADWVAVGSDDGTVSLVEPGGKVLKRIDPPAVKGFVQAMCVHPTTGAVYASFRGDVAQLMVLEEGRWRAYYKHHQGIGCAAFDPPSPLMAVAEEWFTVAIVDPRDGKILARTRAEEEGFIKDPANFTRPCWVPGRPNHLVCRDYIGRLELYRYDSPGTLARIWTTGQTSPATAFMLEPGGAWLATGRFQGHVEMLDAADGKVVYAERISAGDHDRVSIAVDSSGRVAYAGSALGVLHAWSRDGWGALVSQALGDKPLRALLDTRHGLYVGAEDGTLRLLVCEPLVRSPR